MENDPNDEKLDRLFAAARETDPYPVDREYGFETRVMAKIRETRQGEIPFLSCAWRLIPVFVTLLVLIVVWMYASESNYAIDMSAINSIGNEDTTLVAFLTGE